MYMPHFICFLGILEEIIENDPELKLEWSNLLKQREIDRQDYKKRIKKKYFNKKGLELNDQELESIESTYHTKAAAKKYDDVVMDNGIIEVGNELIRIYHHTTDKGTIRCGPFHLSELPEEAIELLRKDGKIRPLS